MNRLCDRIKLTERESRGWSSKQCCHPSNTRTGRQKVRGYPQRHPVPTERSPYLDKEPKNRHCRRVGGVLSLGRGIF